MAKAAFQCKAYARSLMSFEQQILTLQQQGNQHLEDYYDRVHEIYAHLDEPDGMEGVSSLILSPSLEHQIREHESTGKWTAAQSCWEVRLQHNPDNLEYHLGLLRCLRNLGHYGMAVVSSFEPLLTPAPLRHTTKSCQRCPDEPPRMGIRPRGLPRRKFMDGGRLEGH